mgnify:CR=1 FL=1
MSGHYDELTPEQVDAARTVIAVLTATADTEADVLTLLRSAAEESPTLVVEGFAIVLDALLQMIEAELGQEPREVLEKLGRFLAS